MINDYGNQIGLRCEVATQHGEVFVWDDSSVPITLEMVARPLSKICRFSGQCRNFVSVADHSIAVAWIVDRRDHDPRVLLGALLHDAHEALVGDMTWPVKQNIRRGTYAFDNLERWTSERVLKCLGPGPLSDTARALIKDADRLVGFLETITQFPEPANHERAEWLLGNLRDLSQIFGLRVPPGFGESGEPVRRFLGYSSVYNQALSQRRFEAHYHLYRGLVQEQSKKELVSLCEANMSKGRG